MKKGEEKKIIVVLGREKKMRAEKIPFGSTIIATFG